MTYTLLYDLYEYSLFLGSFPPQFCEKYIEFQNNNLLDTPTITTKY